MLLMLVYFSYDKLPFIFGGGGFVNPNRAAGLKKRVVGGVVGLSKRDINYIKGLEIISICI